MRPWLSLLAAIVSTSPMPAVPAVAAIATVARQADCGDFLGQMGRRPAHLTYAGCSYLPDEQGKPLRATYRVDGRYAPAIEASLVRSVRLNRLRRTCCQWDAPPKQFTDMKGREYTIRMVSEETAIASRKGWPRIRQFEVTVDALTEEI